MNLPFIKCNACNKLGTFKPFYIKPMMHLRSTLSEEVFFISKCSNCGYVRQMPVRPKKVYYDLGYHTQKNYEEHCINRASYIADFLQYAIRSTIKYDDRFDILDLGSGRGGVGHFIKKEILNIIATHKLENGDTLTLDWLSKEVDKIEVTGITLHKETETYINTIYLDIDDVKDLNKIPNKKYNLIIMSHCLEHLINPDIIIDYIDKHLLKDKGLLYIEVPSLNTTKVRTLEQFIPHHISYFTKKSLSNLLKTNSGLYEYKIKESSVWGNIKAVYIKLKISNDEQYKPEKFVETKYVLSQIKNKIKRIIIRVFKIQISPND